MDQKGKNKLSQIYSSVRYMYNIKYVVVVYRLVRDPRANYKQSLKVLEHVKKLKPDMITKTSLMLGLGETDSQILRVLEGKKKRE